MELSFGKYVATKELGKGAMGVIYLGYDKTLDRPVAIKTIASSMKEQNLEARFIREAQSTAKLRHNNIVTIYDFGREGEQLFIVMEYLEGHDLQDLISAKTPMDIKEKLDIIRQICLGLDYAHRNGVLHRDIKPANILVLGDGTVKIVDFGLAAIHTSTPTLTQSSAIMGTPHYIAPERIYGEKACAQSDQFSVGLILYELLTYSCPFTGDTISSIIFKILNTEPKRLDPKIFSMFPEIGFIIKKAIAKDPGRRYRSMKEMAADIGDLQQKMAKQGFSLAAPVDTADEPMEALDAIGGETYKLFDNHTVKLEPIKRRRLETALLLTLAVLGLLTVVYFLFLSPGTPAPVSTPVPGPVSAPGAAQEGVLAFDVKPYAAIDEVVNLESQQPLQLTDEYRTTPLKLNLPPGKYRIVYSHPQWKGKTRAKIVTVTAGETIFQKDVVDQNFVLDAIKHFSIPE